MNIVHRQSFEDGWDNGTVIYYFDGSFEDGFVPQKVTRDRFGFAYFRVNRFLKGHEFEHIHTKFSDPFLKEEDIPEEHKERMLLFSPHYQGLLCKKCGCMVSGSIGDAGEYQMINGIQTQMTGKLDMVWLLDAGYKYGNMYMKNYVPKSCDKILTEEEWNMNEALQ